MSDENKIDCQRDIQQYIQEELTDAGMDATISYYLTSIYDHSVFEALSKVIQVRVTAALHTRPMYNVFGDVLFSSLYTSNSFVCENFAETHNADAYSGDPLELAYVKLQHGEELLVRCRIAYLPCN